MGSISSRPKVPEPQVVYVPATPSTPSVSTTTEGSGDSTSTSEERARETRTQNLLQRNRGRLGTILSGFRGVLNASNSSQRKTLLGE